MAGIHPDTEAVRAALALAVRAPSVHNTQLWQWRVGDRTVHLYADDSRRLPHTDPDGRDDILSCGWHCTISALPKGDPPVHRVDQRGGTGARVGDLRLCR